jgi:dTDP-4-dehydrorhamnose 3,5-epimerase
MHARGKMKVHLVEIEGLKVIELDVWRDHRGFFVERFKEDAFQQAGLPSKFVQDNHSQSFPGVLRGLHFQQNPGQGKLVGVVHGKIWDIVVDIRPNSPTFGRKFSIELSSDNGKLLWIPAGFAHGFCVLGNDAADVFYKVDSPYNPKGESGIFWQDPDLMIPWPIAQPIVSDRDQKLPPLQEWKTKWGIQ